MTKPAMQRRQSFRALALGATAIVSMAALAAPAAAADADNAAASPITVTEVVVTAEKRSENIQSVPSSVTSVGENLIGRLQAQGLSDVSAYVPGLNVQSSGVDANRLVIRGLTTGPNDISPSVGVYVDDAPFGSNVGFALGALFSPDVDPFDLDHIEILRGPQGTLYGASTLGGLIKFVTKAPDPNAFDGHLRVDWGDEDETGAENYAVRGGLNIPIAQDKAALRVSGFYSHADGDLTDVRTGRTGLNTTTKYGGRVDLMLKPTDALTVDLVAFFDHSDTPHLGVVDGNADTLQPTYGQYAGFNYVDGFARSHYEVYEGNIRYQFADGVTATSSTSYSIFSVDELADDTTVFQPALGPLGPLFEFEGVVAPSTKKFTEEFRLTSPANHHFEWLAGFFYDHEDSDYLAAIDSTFEFGATPPPPLASTVAALANYETVTNLDYYREYAGFADATYYLTPTLDLSAGVRFSHNNQNVINHGSGFLVAIGVLPANPILTPSSDNVWTESFDARWHYDTNSIVYARVSRGYRPGGPNVTGKSFSPDTTWNYELGTKTTALDGRLTADLSLFYIDWQNIQLNFFNGMVTVINNAGDARSEGVEFEGGWTPIRGLTFSANGAYTDAYITFLKPGAEGGAAIGDQLPFNSKWTGALRADYYFPLAMVEANLGASLRYRSDFTTTFPGDTGTRFYQLPSTTFLDLRAGVSFEHRYALNFQVLNVADERRLSGAAEFLAVSAAAADAAGQPVDLSYTPGRTYGLSLTATF